MKYKVTPEQETKIVTWLKERNGVAVWRNCNLSSHSIGTEAFTPATQADGSPAQCPGWQYGGTPIAVTTDANDFVVEVFEPFAKMRVMPGKYGPPCDPIKRGRDKVDKALALAGEGAYWQFDYSTRSYGSAWIDAIVFKHIDIRPLNIEAVTAEAR